MTVRFTRRLLDALIVLAVTLALPIFWLIEKIIEFRGNGGHDESKNLRGFSFLPIPPDEMSPPTRAAVLSLGTPCCPILEFVKGKGAK